VSDEEFALPPLGLLRSLAAGTIDSNMKPAIAMTRRLKSELPRMLEEHQAIVEALHALIQAATRRDRPEVTAFAEKLTLHAQAEEEVLYPAAILVVEFLEAKLRG
jgi:ribosome-associated translation inhibitor RaiA